MSLIKKLEEKINNNIRQCGYDIDNVSLVKSSRVDLGMYQINDAMKIAKKYGKNPVEVAKEIIESLKEIKELENINIAGPGFINVTITKETLKEYLNEVKKDINNNVDKLKNTKIVIDYGGANIAKQLHVGHLRSANIGQALKNLAVALGNDVIGDAHLGDYGLQVGTIIYETKLRYPDLICFNKNYNGEDYDLPFDKEEINNIYPSGSKKIKESEEAHEEARKITLDMQQGDLGYNSLWNKISSISLEQIKETYKDLNTKFDLYEGEKDSIKYIDKVLKIAADKDLLRISEGATIMDVKEPTDNKEMPPIILVKNDGAYLYGTTDLATIYGRVEKFNPDEIWYVIDNRQSLHIEQVERAARKSGIIKDDLKIKFIGFGTMNGINGKPFKTREGNAMSLNELISIVNKETYNRLNDSITDEEERKTISKSLAIAAIKYADLIPFRGTDYIFDPVKFSDLEGKTGPYLLYSAIRIKSLLRNAKAKDIEFNNINSITEKEQDIAICIINMTKVLQNSYESKSLNEIADYLYELSNIYNKFYTENKILVEENIEKRETWLSLSSVVLDTILYLLDILAIKCPNKM